MNHLSPFLYASKKAVLETLSLLGLMDVLIFVGCFLVFVLFYFLACACSQMRFFIPQFLKCLAFLVLLIAPVLLLWLGQNVLYKNETTYQFAKRLEYSPTYLADGMISNVGRLAIGHCYLIVEGLRNPSNKRNIVANMISPLKKYKFRINQKIAVGDSVKFRHVIEDFPYLFYREFVQCYGGKL